MIYRRFLKQPLDFVSAILAIIVLSPILLIVAVLVKVKLGSPIIFRQQRPGIGEKIFTMYKFRTMTNQRDENGKLLPDSARLTGFGRFLRSLSLDELPQLFNILQGKMSFIGPRPLLIDYLPLYNSQQKRRHEVRPGLSGLAQINGRNSVSWESRLCMDIYYVDNISFLGDCKITWLTIKAVFRRDGICSESSATMEPFRGTGSREDYPR